MTTSRRITTLPAIGVMSVAGIALVLTGCGSSSNGSGGGDRETIGTSTTSLGTFLTADEGRSVYLWEGDHGTTSNCTGACASVWSPVTTEGAPKAEGSAVASDLGTTKRSDGKTQVTYHGHPLYYYAGDSSKGQTTGEGNNGFGAKWYLVKPSGSALDDDGSSPSSPSSPSMPSSPSSP
ncbi:MAG: COG4315 family predicted lipoprotein [Marmoricola sp.]